MAEITQDVSIAAAVSLNGEGCAKGCAEAEECAFAIVSVLGNEGSPWLYVNEKGGIFSQWSGIGLTSWTTEDPSDVFGVGDFLTVINGGETLPLAVSGDKGSSVSYVAGATSMATYEPYAGDCVHPSLCIIVGGTGRVWLSTDYGQTYTEVESGSATAQNLTKVKICRRNPSVVYAIGASNAIIKSTNGGYSWFALTGPSATDALTAIEIVGENDVLVGNDDGELWQTTDGGETWTQQAELPDLDSSPAITAISSCPCGSIDKAGVTYVVATGDGLPAQHKVYRNTGWGTGQWVAETGFDALTTDYAPADVVCCDNNRALVVGGDGANTGFVAVIS